jgi:hypothetical protein
MRKSVGSSQLPFFRFTGIESASYSDRPVGDDLINTRSVILRGLCRVVQLSEIVRHSDLSSEELRVDEQRELGASAMGRMTQIK